MRLATREEKKPIVRPRIANLCSRSNLDFAKQLEDDDPFARPSAFSSLPSPRSPLPFTALLALPPPRTATIPANDYSNPPREALERISVASEPVTPRKAKPLSRHEQYSEYASTTNTTGGSEPSSYLFRSAPFPPIRDLKGVNGQLLSRSIRESAPSPPCENNLQSPLNAFRRDSFDEFVHSPSESLGTSSSRSTHSSSAATASSSTIHLSRLTAEPLFAGSSFSFLLAISSPEHPPTTSEPLLVSITFVGFTSASTSSDSSTHLLFELVSTLELTESSWKGNATIPLAATCLSCGVTSDELPWSFYYREEDGSEWETKYEMVASCDGFVEGKMGIEIGAALSASGSATGESSKPSILEDIKGWRLETEPKMGYRIATLDGWELPSKLDPSTRIALHLSLVCRFIPTSSSSTCDDLDSLISEISPARASISLRAVLRSGTTGEAIPLGASWRNRVNEVEFHLTTNGDEAVTVSHEWIMDSRAVALAQMSSCAGFAVEFELTIRFSEPTAPPNTPNKPAALELVMPFLPFPQSLSQTPDSLSSPSPLTLPTSPREINRRAFFTESASIAEKGEIAKQRWAKLRRIFSIRRRS